MNNRLKHYLLIKQSWELLKLRTTEQWIEDMTTVKSLVEEAISPTVVDLNDRHGENVSRPVTVDFLE
jgi:hypothetical protein